MKKFFSIEIKEVLKDIVEVEAENSEEAVLKAEQGYYDSIYVLDGIECDRDLSFSDIKSPYYVSDKRKETIFYKLIDYVFEHTINEKDFYSALKNIIGLTDSEITELKIDVLRQVESLSPILENEIMFDDEIIFENNVVNAYIPLYNINIFEKFKIVERENTEYDLYLDYDLYENKCLVHIIEKNDFLYVTYEYKPSIDESKMLNKKLDEYCQKIYGQSLQKEIEELNQNEYECEE